MPDLLFEIGTEELPPSLIENLTNQIKNNITSELKEKYIEVKDEQVKTYNSPRRIAIIIDNLPRIQEIKELEVKGPDKTKAFVDGKPTQAAIGFAKKYNLEPKDLKIKEVNGSEYVFVNVKIGGGEVKSILSETLPNSLKKTTGDKFMKWGNHEEKFARPIRWITAILDKDIVSFTYAGLTSSNKTTPHRFNKNKSIEIKSPKEYEELLSKNNTICDKTKRKEKIQNLLNNKADEIGLKPLIDESLLNEVANITEDPAALICQFDDSYLELPECVIETVLRKHQKYFVLKDENNKLTNKFVVITNGTGKEENIKKGNEKVVRARLNDAKFFYEEDLKRPFTYEERIKDLSKITFQKGLGTMQEKTERVVELSEYIFNLISKSKDEIKNGKFQLKKNTLLDGAKLCKLDLVTHMVFEMPELQGLVGKEYAIKNSFSEIISSSIAGHYNPSNIDTAGMIIGLADRIDNLICLFSIGKIPTSSTDPFALRVQTNWLFNIVDRLQDQYSTTLNINSIIDSHSKKIKADAEIGQKVKDFLKERFRLRCESTHTALPDHINAVFATKDPLDNIQDCSQNINLLSKYFTTQEEKEKAFLVAAKRSIKIVSNDTSGSLDTDKLKTGEEKTLLNHFNEIENNSSYKDIEEYYKTLRELSTPINSFFEKVLVNDPDPKIKEARQGLLKKGKMLFEKICDFNQIVERN
jgi:glycyl-tRNA synthetase beta chain